MACLHVCARARVRTDTPLLPSARASPAFRSYFFTMETGGIDTAAMDDENEARLTSSGVE
jgi:hypothetical protein